MEFNDFYSTNFTNEEIQEIKRFIFKNLNSSIHKTVEKFCNKYDIEVSKGYKIIQTENSKIRTIETLKRLETEKTINKIKKNTRSPKSRCFKSNKLQYISIAFCDIIPF